MEQAGLCCGGEEVTVLPSSPPEEATLNEGEGGPGERVSGGVGTAGLAPWHCSQVLL